MDYVIGLLDLWSVLACFWHYSYTHLTGIAHNRCETYILHLYVHLTRIVIRITVTLHLVLEVTNEKV